MSVVSSTVDKLDKEIEEKLKAALEQLDGNINAKFNTGKVDKARKYYTKKYSEGNKLDIYFKTREVVLYDTLLTSWIKSNRLPMVQALLHRGASLLVTDDAGNSPLHLAIIQENLELCSILIKAGADVNAKNKKLQTPLHLVLRMMCNSITKKILQENIALLLLDNKANVHARTLNHVTPLHLAAAINNPSVIRKLLKENANVNAMTLKDRKTPFHVVLQKGSPEMVELLILHGADMNAKTLISGKTPLHYAVMSGKIENVSRLLALDRARNSSRQYNTSLNAASNKLKSTFTGRLFLARTPLEMALKQWDLTMMDYLVVTCRASCGSLREPFHKNFVSQLPSFNPAKTTIPLRLLKWLLEHNVKMGTDHFEQIYQTLASDVSLMDKMLVTHQPPYSLLKWACERDNMVVIKWMFEKTTLVEGLKTQEKWLSWFIDEILVYSLMADKKAILEYLLSRIEDNLLPSIQNLQPYALLKWASEKNNMQIAKLLFEKTKIVEGIKKEKDKLFWFMDEVLSCALKADNKEMLEHLCSKVQDFEISSFQNKSVHSLFKLICDKNNSLVMKWLLEEVDIVSDFTKKCKDEGDGISFVNEFLGYAVKTLKKEILDDLYSRLEKGLSTFIALAAVTGNLEIIQWLMQKPNAGQYRSHIDGSPNSEPSALYCAIAYNRPNILDFLIEHGAKLEGVQYLTGETLMHAAARAGIEMTKRIYNALLQAKKTPPQFFLNVADSKGNTPLHMAGMAGNDDVIHFLMEHGADLDERNQAGRNLLHLYLKKGPGSERMIEFLIVHSKNAQEFMDHADSEGIRPIDIAIKNNNLIAVKILGSLGVSRSIETRKRSLTLILEADKKKAEEAAELYTIIEDMYSAATTGTSTPVDRNLLLLGIGLNFKFHKGRTILHQAVFHNRTELVIKILTHALLLEERGKHVINAHNQNGNTPLHLAAIKDNAEMVTLLLNHNADIDNQNNDGNTPLHVAIQKQSKLAVKALLNKVAASTLEIANKQAKKIVDWAAQLAESEPVSDAPYIHCLVLCTKLRLLALTSLDLSNDKAVRSFLRDRNMISRFLSRRDLKTFGRQSKEIISSSCWQRCYPMQNILFFIRL